MLQKNYRVAIYCRLSREDGNEESQSIQSQREILTKYVEQQGWFIVGIYADDGYSGTNFERPDFKRMLTDIEIGRIDLVITKDLSRLGRNYIQTGYYTEEYFPEHNVRYIALNDNFDTGSDEGSDFAPFKNIINEWYAKDISKKIRFTLDNKAKNGEPRNTVFPIFGYMYNEAYERIPDPETAPIVQMIYRKYVELGSSLKVIRYLKSQNIKIPSYYNALKYGYNKKKVLAKSEDELTNWGTDVVRDMLVRREYLGDYITARSKSKNFKNKKRYDNEDCYIFENRYEPLIDRETWETANKLLKRTRAGTVPMIKNTYKGLIFCPDCGKLMRLERRSNPKKKIKLSEDDYDYRYFCSNKKCGKINSIPKHSLDSILKKELVNLKDLILNNKEEFIKFAQNFNRDGIKIKANLTEEIDKHIQRDKEIDNYIQNLFEKNANGIIPESTFNIMVQKYNKEKEFIRQTIKDLTRQQQKEFSQTNNDRKIMQFIEWVSQIDCDSEISVELIHKIINTIEVKSTRINNSVKNKIFNITIKYVYCDDILKEYMTYDKRNKKE